MKYDSSGGQGFLKQICARQGFYIKYLLAKVLPTEELPLPPPICHGRSRLRNSKKYSDQILTLCFPNTANHKATQLRPLSSFPEIDSKSEIWFCSCYSAVVALLSIRPTEKILIS